MTLAELKNLVEQVSHRSDLVDQYDTFIELAEGLIATNLRAREMIAQTTLEETDRVVTNERTYMLPTDFLEERMVSHSDFPLTKIGLTEALQYPQSGRVWAYALRANNIPLIDFVDTPALDAEIDMEYWQRPAHLVNDEDTNELLTNFPTIYLQGALFFLFYQSQDLELAQTASDIFVDQVATVNEQAGRFLGGTMERPSLNLGNFRMPGGY